MIQPSSISSLTHQDSPSPISSQNSTSGDDTSLYMRNQQQQKKKGIRNSLGRLFTRKPGSIDNKPMHESIHQPMSSYQSHYSATSTARGKEIQFRNFLRRRTNDSMSFCFLIEKHHPYLQIVSHTQK